MQPIECYHIENYSGKIYSALEGIRVVKRRDYFVQKVTLTGDAPKNFVGIFNYDYPHSWRRNNKRHWTKYIAKTGHKWYPNESITEYLTN